MTLSNYGYVPPVNLQALGPMWQQLTGDLEAAADLVCLVLEIMPDLILPRMLGVYTGIMDHQYFLFWATLGPLRGYPAKGYFLTNHDGSDIALVCSTNWQDCCARLRARPVNFKQRLWN